MNPDELLARMVAIPSVSGDESAIADFVTEYARSAGLVVERIRNSVMVTTGRRAPTLWLLSHLDTVPVGNGWTVDPGVIEWRDGRLYGRGSNDAKVSGAAMLSALVDLRETAAGDEVAVVLTACEETNNSGMNEVLEAKGRPQACICGEPTGLEVVCAQGGLSVLTATWRGVSCHAAHAKNVKNDNALLKAARDLSTLPNVVEVGEEHPLLARTTVVATQLKVGERHNVVPDLAEAVFDARLSPTAEADAVRARLAELLPNAEVMIRSKRLQAVDTPPDHPVVLAALAAARRVHPLASKTLSDMAFLKGVPAVKCGPGQTARSHTPDEFVMLDELLAGVAFYRDAASRITRALEGAEGRT